MKEKKWMLAICFTAFLVLFASGTRAEQAQIACITCHQAFGGKLAMPVAGWKGSIHAQHGITCDRCHGGNAKVAVGNVMELSPPEFAATQAAAMSKANGFVAKPTGRRMFDMCAKCHPASVSRYAGSIMGKAYLENRGGPSCVACHHPHRNVILAVSQVCSKCHKDTAGFQKIDPMNVTDATITELSKIRIELAGEKTQGARPSLAPRFAGEMSSYQVGLLAFGAIIFLFLLSVVVYRIFEKGDEK